ncbi:MAG: aldose 1-epimerase [Nitriliruptoraceae bacterium]
MTTPRVRLEAGDTHVEVDPADGARLTSLVVDGRELLVTGSGGGVGYGCFVMAPWAGRLRDGRVSADRRTLQLRREPDDGHALHGLVHDRPWTLEATGPDRARLHGTVPAASLDRADPSVGADGWFTRIDLVQDIHLHPDRLELRLTATPTAPTPCTLGWHPWFRRHLDDAEVVLDVPAAQVLRKDRVGIATLETVPVPAPPWDDAFTGLTGPVRLRWPGMLELELHSDAPVVVVFTGRTYGVCVEPQSGPPDEPNLAERRMAGPDDPLTLTSTWRWRTA